MDDRISRSPAEPTLPFAEDKILETVRRHLRSHRDPRRADEILDLPWKVGQCAPVVNPVDKTIEGYRLTVLIDPKLGVPVEQPGLAPRWAASSVLVVTLAPEGDRLIPRDP